MAGPHPVILDQHASDAARPVGQLRIAAAAATADQGRAVAEATLVASVGQLHGGVQMVRMNPSSREFGLLVVAAGWQNVSSWVVRTKHEPLGLSCHHMRRINE